MSFLLQTFFINSSLYCINSSLQHLGASKNNIWWPWINAQKNLWVSWMHVEPVFRSKCRWFHFKEICQLRPYMEGWDAARSPLHVRYYPWEKCGTGRFGRSINWMDPVRWSSRDHQSSDALDLWVLCSAFCRSTSYLLWTNRFFVSNATFDPVPGNVWSAQVQAFDVWNQQEILVLFRLA